MQLLWIQNDLFARHYIADAEAKNALLGHEMIAKAMAALGLVAAGAGLMRLLAPALS